ncbi:A/G-specific adenine glycosylase [Asaia krungthepensis]|uniref:Adenine DNA glycosylase n=1 Tax=Asaia krungthepensis NRIC 0535 TaxID=1307925 RepID=A0ABQ0PVN7_9PROT|nr:A/G-specific adenine glycosylase [Asaia krungthepensis]GBQ82756.1 DNA glycosylase A/G-specific MutY [Asaia krungthepensis NRIC 0535]
MNTLAGYVLALHIARVTPSASSLLDWYARQRRILPWRALPGQSADPYAVWLSEIMLQQTTVVTVMPYYERFLKRYPTVHDLAASPLQDVLSAWAGLGYYSRARNLHACATIVSARGGFPDTVEQLQALPGIGAYTARAIASIAFGVPVVPVDGNVERITARLHAMTEPLPQARRQLDKLAEHLNHDPDARRAPSDFTQALFDLGAGICTPRRPSCLVCPWRNPCKGHETGDPARFPVKAPRKAKPERHGVIFVIKSREGALWLRHRPEKGLLGGMTEFPGTAWLDEPISLVHALSQAPVALEPEGRTWKVAGQIRHVFTHFVLNLTVVNVAIADFSPLHNQDGFACPPDALKDQALPSVMNKCLALAQ